MGHEYDIAISFAGEDRSIANTLAQGLKDKGVRVFFDEFAEAQLWGENLYEYLHDVYSKKARFCIMLLSAHYARKAWTNHERKSAQERAFKESQAYILPVKLDDTSIPGILDTVGYISLKTKTIDDLIAMVLVKLDMSSAGKPAEQNRAAGMRPSIPIPQIKKTFTERDKDIFFDTTFAAIRAFFQEGIKELNNIPNIEADIKDITSNKFMCRVYVQGNRKSACTIWLGSQFSSHGICYSNAANPDAGSSMNDSLFLEVTDSGLFLKPLMNFSGNQVNNLDAMSAANYFWTRLTDPLKT